MVGSDRDSEPAEPTTVRPTATDPEAITVVGRRRTSIADCSRSDVSIEDLPKPLVECGCGDCGSMADPLQRYDGGSGLDWSSFDSATWSTDACPDPRPLSVERAGEVFRRYDRARYADDGTTAKCERELSNYRTIMERDRYARREYGDDLTTVLLSFRVSPVIRDGVERQWANPLLLADALLVHQSEVLRRALNVRRQVDGLQYAWVVTGTEKYATPHWHLYLWCDDPDDDVRAFDFTNAVDHHTDGYLATDDAHPIDRHGDDGAVSVDLAPTVADTETGTTVETDDGETVDLSAIRRAVRDDDDPYREATKGAIYVASQLPYLASLDSDPHPVDCQTAAIKWTHCAVRNRQWFGTSQLPTDE